MESTGSKVAPDATFVAPGEPEIKLLRSVDPVGLAAVPEPSMEPDSTNSPVRVAKGRSLYCARSVERAAEVCGHGLCRRSAQALLLSPTATGEDL